MSFKEISPEQAWEMVQNGAIFFHNSLSTIAFNIV